MLTPEYIHTALKEGNVLEEIMKEGMSGTRLYEIITGDNKLFNNILEVPMSVAMLWLHQIVNDDTIFTNIKNDTYWVMKSNVFNIVVLEYKDEKWGLIFIL